MNPRNSLYRQTLEEEKRTVGGLLLLFCVTRTVISPVYQVAQYWFLFDQLGGVVPALARFPLLYVLLAVDTMLTLLGIWAGAQLWQMRASGIWLAKIYLVASFVLSFAMSLAFQVLGMGAVAQALATQAVPTAFWSVLWFIYLLTSERIRNIREIDRERQQTV